MKKFLFYFPLKSGNIVFGCTILLVALSTGLYHVYKLATNERNFPHKERHGSTNVLINVIMEMREGFIEEAKNMFFWWYTAYVIITSVLFIFAVLYTYGVYKANYYIVTTFFVYGVLHLIGTIPLIVWEGMCQAWIRLALLVIFGTFMAICMPSVKYLMDAIKSGTLYARPGEVMIRNVVEDGTNQRDQLSKDQKPFHDILIAHQLHNDPPPNKSQDSITF